MVWLVYLTFSSFSREESQLENTRPDWPIAGSVGIVLVKIHWLIWEDKVCCSEHHSLGLGPGLWKSGESELGCFHFFATDWMWCD